jgi:glucose-1-phosphate thymidylyltransferase
LRPLTFTGNKHMIPIANQPMLFYGLRHLADAGIHEVAIVLGTIHEGIREAIGDGSAFGLSVEYVHQGAPRGLADAVRCARSFLGEDAFVMYLGDNLLQGGVAPLTRAFLEHPSDAVVAVSPVEDPRQYGVVELDGDRIVSLEEKPVEPKSRLALVGIYLFTPKIHAIVERLQPSRRNELEITEAIWQLHAAGGRIQVVHVEGWWKDTGRPTDLLEANARILRGRPPGEFQRKGSVDPRALLTGPVELGEGSRIDAGAVVAGPVVIGRNVRISPGSRVGPCTALGDRVTLDGGEVLNSIVLEGASISGGLSIRDSIIGRESTIEASAEGARPLRCILGDAARLWIG